MRCAVLRGRVCFAVSRSSHQGVPHVLVTPSVVRGVTAFMPLSRRSRDRTLLTPITTESLLARRQETR